MKRKILVSQCLYGEVICRYDGGEKAETSPIFLRWKAEGRLVPVCPEVWGGLPVPRPDAQRKGDRVISREGRDVTAEYTRGARQALETALEQDVLFAVMKEKSPACGVHRIHDGSFSGVKIPGMGVATEMLRRAGVAVFSEEELESAAEYLEEAERSEAGTPDREPPVTLR